MLHFTISLILLFAPVTLLCGETPAWKRELKPA